MTTKFIRLNRQITHQIRKITKNHKTTNELALRRKFDNPNVITCERDARCSAVFTVAPPKINPARHYHSVIILVCILRRIELKARSVRRLPKLRWQIYKPCRTWDLSARERKGQLIAGNLKNPE